MTGQGTMKRNTSRGEHAYELFHPKPAKAPIGWPMFKTGQKRPSGVRFKTGQSALGSDAPSKSPSRLVKSTRRNYCESFCPNHVHWPVLKRPSLAGFQAPLDTRIEFAIRGAHQTVLTPHLFLYHGGTLLHVPRRLLLMTRPPVSA
jgi:hypothetical protein